MTTVDRRFHKIDAGDKVLDMFMRDGKVLPYRKTVVSRVHKTFWNGKILVEKVCVLGKATSGEDCDTPVCNEFFRWDRENKCWNIKYPTLTYNKG